MGTWPRRDDAEACSAKGVRGVLLYGLRWIDQSVEIFISMSVRQDGNDSFRGNSLLCDSRPDTFLLWYFW